MRCIFTINDKSESTYPLLRTAINSLQANTTLEPIVIWSGNDNKMSEWLIRRDISIIRHELSFKKEIEHFDFWDVDFINNDMKNMYTFYSDYYNKNFIETESLRIDIPILFDKESYVLYADCDVVFLDDIKMEPFKQHLAVAKRHIFNNGIMFLNIAKMKECYQEFKDYYIKSNYNFAAGMTTQGAYNEFFKNKIHEIPWEYNWHWFWGKNPNIRIVHFCGPKIMQWQDILENKNKYELIYRNVVKNIPLMNYNIEKWNNFCEQDDKIELLKDKS